MDLLVQPFPNSDKLLKLAQSGKLLLNAPATGILVFADRLTRAYFEVISFDPATQNLTFKLDGLQYTKPVMVANYTEEIDVPVVVVREGPNDSMIVLADPTDEELIAFHISLFGDRFIYQARHTLLDLMTHGEVLNAYNPQLPMLRPAEVTAMGIKITRITPTGIVLGTVAGDPFTSDVTFCAQTVDLFVAVPFKGTFCQFKIY